MALDSAATNRDSTIDTLKWLLFAKASLNACWISLVVSSKISLERANLVGDGNTTRCYQSLYRDIIVNPDVNKKFYYSGGRLIGQK